MSQRLCVQNPDAKEYKLLVWVQTLHCCARKTSNGSHLALASGRELPAYKAVGGKVAYPKGLKISVHPSSFTVDISPIFSLLPAHKQLLGHMSRHRPVLVGVLAVQQSGGIALEVG